LLPIPKPIARRLWALGEEWERENRPRVAGDRARRLPPRWLRRGSRPYRFARRPGVVQGPESSSGVHGPSRQP